MLAGCAFSEVAASSRQIWVSLSALNTSRLNHSVVTKLTKSPVLRPRQRPPRPHLPQPRLPTLEYPPPRHHLLARHFRLDLADQHRLNSRTKRHHILRRHRNPAVLLPHYRLHDQPPTARAKAPSTSLVTGKIRDGGECFCVGVPDAVDFLFDVAAYDACDGADDELVVDDVGGCADYCCGILYR
jgi:hypothetical protein